MEMLKVNDDIVGEDFEVVYNDGTHVEIEKIGYGTIHCFNIDKDGNVIDIAGGVANIVKNVACKYNEFVEFTDQIMGDSPYAFSGTDEDGHVGFEHENNDCIQFDIKV